VSSQRDEFPSRGEFLRRREAKSLVFEGGPEMGNEPAIRTDIEVGDPRRHARLVADGCVWRHSKEKCPPATSLPTFPRSSSLE